MKTIIIKNETASEITVLLEPIALNELVGSGKSLRITGEFDEDELLIDVCDNGQISIWCYPEADFERT